MAEKFPTSLEELFSEMHSHTKATPRWFGITGSWKKTNGQVENDVRESVRRVYGRGDGIVSGGALSVDFFAADEALRLDPGAERMKIICRSPSNAMQRITENVRLKELSPLNRPKRW